MSKIIAFCNIKKSAQRIVPAGWTYLEANIGPKNGKSVQPISWTYCDGMATKASVIHGYEGRDILGATREAIHNTDCGNRNQEARSDE